MHVLIVLLLVLPYMRQLIFLMKSDLPYTYTYTYLTTVRIYMYMYVVGSSPTRGSSFFLGKVTALGVLCCIALFVCLTLLASFFIPSHLSFSIHVCSGPHLPGVFDVNPPALDIVLHTLNFILHRRVEVPHKAKPSRLPRLVIFLDLQRCT